MQVRLIHLIVEHQFGSQMMAKGVVAEEEVIAGEITEHAVRPMQHGGRDKSQLLVAQAQGVAGFHHLEIPVLMIIAGERLHPVGRAIDRRIRDVPHQFGQSPTVIDLGVIGHHIVYALQINHLFEPVHEFLGIGRPDRVYQGHFFIPHQIGIVA